MTARSTDPQLAIGQAVQDVWVSSTEAAHLLQVSDRTMRRQADQYRSRETRRDGCGGKRLEYQLESLGLEAIQRWGARTQIQAMPTAEIAEATMIALAAPTGTTALTIPDDLSELAAAFERADNRTRIQFQRRFQILSACNGIMGRRDLQDWVDSWNRAHPDQLAAVGTIYRWRQELEQDGFAGLLCRESRLPQSTVRDSWFQDFRAAYLDQGRLSANTSRMVALGKALQRSEITDVASFPSVHAFLRRLESETAPALIEYARFGKKRHYDRNGIHIERDYSQLPVGRVWVGDTHTWDVFVRVGADPIPVTCYLTLFLDMASQNPMGWHFHISAPSAENSMRALRDGIIRWGVPSEILVDNGREYKNRDFSGMTHGHVIRYDEQATQSLASVLGIHMRFAMPKNARAKIIERNFREIKDKFSRFWGTFKGGNVLEKPERLKSTLKRGDIPLFSDFCEAANQFLSETFPAFAHGGKFHQGRTRAQVLAEGLTKPLDRLGPETISRLVSRTITARVQNRGVNLASAGCWWWADDWMSMWVGKEVQLRYDPENLHEAWCYEPNGPFIGVAKLREAISALVDPQDEVSKARLTQQMRERRLQEKQLRNLFPERRMGDVREDLAALGAALGAQAPQIPAGGNIRLTPHDHSAATAARKAKEGRADLARLAPDTDTPTKQPLRWYDEPVALAG